MPLLDIATAQPSLQYHLGPLRAQTLTNAKVLSSNFILRDEKRLCFTSKLFQFTNKANINFGHLERRGKLMITAVAILEPECLVHKEDGEKSVGLGVVSGLPKIQFESSDAESKGLDEREKLRRMRISKANKGNTPWNKGRKHSPETLQRIRERTRLAMQNPKIKMKLANLGHAQSDETRKKIGAGVRLGWEKRREKLMVQENCHFEWQNLIAEASRKGLAGEEEMQWDSYSSLDEQLKQEWLESVEQRKTMPRLKGSKRAPKSPEQKRKIAEAIAAKWADPEYRERVCAGLTKFHGTPVGAERKPKRKPSGTKQSIKRMPTQKKETDTKSLPRNEPKSTIERFKLRRSNTPLYKDPSASTKLEMIKNIRAQREAVESKKSEAIERARLLIAEAEKAAKALEFAAVKSPIARASLIETRKLIAEAIQSIESIETGEITSNNEDGSSPSVVSAELMSQGEKETAETENGGLNWPEHTKINGNQTLKPCNDEDLNFASFAMSGKLNGEELLPINSNGYSLQTLNLESLIQQSDSAKQLGYFEPNGNSDTERNLQPNGSKFQNIKEEKPSKLGIVTKKWVRGRLVEVTEES